MQIQYYEIIKLLRSTVALIVYNLLSMNDHIDLDLDSKRLEMAKKLGADITIQVQRDQTSKQVASHVKESLQKAPNKVIECTGAESSINTGMYVSIGLL